MSYALATVETWYSLLRSTIAPQALLDTAQRFRMPALGIVDQATTLGHVPIAQAARDTSVHIAFGATLMLDDGYPLRVLARNELGYRNLCRLIYLQANRGARLSYQTIQDHRAGLYVLAGGRRGRLWQALAASDERVVWLLARLQALADHEDHFVVEVQQDERGDEHALLRSLLDLVERSGVRAIATHDVHVLDPTDAPKHRLLSAIDHQLSFWADDARLPFWRERSRAALPAPQTWQRRWDGLEHLVAGASAVLMDCQVELLGRRRFPGAHLPTTQVYDQLWSRAFNGLKQRYGQVRPDLMERLAHEVNEVMAQEVGPFLIHAAELVERARDRGIKMVLQGSGTGSVLCYALGISPVDPLTAEALVFERFAGRHRGIGDLPDLDFAVAAGREGEVRALLNEMFGAERVAALAAVVTLQERGAIRTAAAAFGWDRAQIRLLHRKLKADDALDRHEQMVISAAEQIAGQPSHLMRHASGVIVADEALAELYGVGRCPDGPMLLANKDDVEALQFLKFDILVWYVLALYDHAEASIHASVYPKPDLWHVPPTDECTGDLLEHADTRSIPGLQSPACMTLIRALRVRTEADIALCLGALRPGASHTRERLMAAIHGGSTVLPGWEQLTPAHQAAVEQVLAPSRGALIFDEDLLRLAHLLGLSFADAERLRKALGRGDRSAPIVNTLRAAALGNGWNDREIAVVLHWFRYIERYTYTKGHAVAMAHVAWRVARIAVYYPVHFYAAVIDNLGLGVAGGMYPILVYVVEARRHLVEVHGPSVNGPWLSTPGEHAVRCGLRVLQGTINEATLQRIHAAARERPFTSVVDLCARVELTPAELERLIAAGAVDELALSRRHARWEAQYARGRPLNQRSLLDEQSWPEPTIIEAEPVWERAAEENATLGFTLSVNHPLDLYAGGDAQTICAEQLAAHVGRRVVVSGMVVAGRRVKTSSGRPIAFATLCDRTAVMELTLFEQAVQRYREHVQVGAVVEVAGVVTHTAERGVGVEVQTLRELRLERTMVYGTIDDPHA